MAQDRQSGGRQYPPTPETVRRGLRKWGSRNRRSYPWRDTPTPFEVLIAELCLRQTGARIAEPAYRSILEKYPTPRDLAAAPVRDLEKVFRPIGLISRASTIIELARELLLHHGGEVPSRFEDLVQLPGVGPYIANAVRCFGYGKRAPIVDGSVKRVLGRIYGRSELADRDAWTLAEHLVPRKDPDLYNYSLLDLGAKLCRPTRPLCHNCPLRRRCMWHSGEKRSS